MTLSKIDDLIAKIKEMLPMTEVSIRGGCYIIYLMPKLGKIKITGDGQVGTQGRIPTEIGLLLLDL